MLGIKTCFLIFVFIWARASLPRIRFDQLMSYCWTVLLPIIIGLIVIMPCLVYSMSIIPINFYLI
jgi:NADH-ubiquinone oxidoreductase chain 1